MKLTEYTYGLEKLGYIILLLPIVLPSSRTQIDRTEEEEQPTELEA